MTTEVRLSTAEAFRHGANWIWSEEGVGRRVGGEASSTYEVRLFRRVFEVQDAHTARLIAHITADSHYELYLNGEQAGDGPAKGDLRHQFFETLDLSRWLKPGLNCLAVRVVDYSPVQCDPPRLGAPGSVMTYRGGLAVDAVLEMGSTSVPLRTDREWMVCRDTSLEFQADDILHGGFVGYFERWICSRTRSGWNLPDDQSEDWKPATELYPAIRFDDLRDSDSPYGLLPRETERLKEERPSAFSRCNNERWGARLLVHEEVECPAEETFEVIYDAGQLETGFPLMEFSGGRGSCISVTYAEALRLPWDTPNAKILGRQINLENIGTGFKDESTGWTHDLRGKLSGFSDFIMPDGRTHRYRPMHWRTFRFVRLRVQVGQEPLILRRFCFTKVAYPFPQLGRFKSDSAFFNTLWETGVRTMTLCSHETFEDCPYYEQLQYAGDSSVTSRLAQFIGGETGLTRQAIRHFDWSRLPEGLTQSRYPSRIPQIIPAFSLHWIEMVRDYYLYTADAELVREVRVGMEAVLGWFQRHCGPHGLPEKLPYWNMTDWCGDWVMGQPPGWDTGPTSTISGLYIRALRNVSWLLSHIGDDRVATLYATCADEASHQFRMIFWNEDKGLFQDQRTGEDTASYSQYGNALAVLSEAADTTHIERLREKFPTSPELARASFFGLHAVCEALCKIDRAEQATGIFEKWREMVDFGLDTWAEDTSYWRSLCHAWSAHPCLSLARILAGIEVIEPGFKKVKIRPLPLGTSELDAVFPTPLGSLHISWKAVSNSIIDLRVDAPTGIEVSKPQPRSATSA